MPVLALATQIGKTKYTHFLRLLEKHGEFMIRPPSTPKSAKKVKDGKKGKPKLRENAIKSSKREPKKLNPKIKYNKLSENEHQLWLSGLLS